MVRKLEDLRSGLEITTQFSPSLQTSSSKKANVNTGKSQVAANGSPVRNKPDSGVVSPTAEEDETLKDSERKPKSRSDSTDGGLGKT